MKSILFLSAAGMSLAIATPAHALISLADPSLFNGEEIVFNDVDAVIEGLTLTGFTNQTHIAYNFEGTTSDGTNLLSGSGGVGQATITALYSDPPQDPVYLTSLTYYREDGGLFNNTEFRFVSPIEGSEINLFAYNQDGIVTDLGLLALGGDNRFGIQATGTDLISRISYVIAPSGGVLGHKQTRLDNYVPGGGLPGPVPEPATWAMMLLGFGAVGAAMRKPRHRVRISYT